MIAKMGPTHWSCKPYPILVHSALSVSPAVHYSIILSCCITWTFLRHCSPRGATIAHATLLRRDAGSSGNETTTQSIINGIPPGYSVGYVAHCHNEVY